MNNVYELINKYGKLMVNQGYTLGSEGRIFLKSRGCCIGTREEANLGELKLEDIMELSRNEVENYLPAKILIDDKNINAIVISNTPYCSRCAKEGKEIYAVLDDMAQIIGPKVSLVDYDKGAITRVLKKSTACIVKDKYTISTGRNLYEATVAMEVLEKAAEVYLKAQVLGGGKKINKFEALLMRYIYKKKYSKTEEKIKSLEVEKL